MATLIDQLGDAHGSFSKAYEDSLEVHGSWDATKDARITLFSKSISTINNVRFGAIFLDGYLRQPKWWPMLTKQSYSSTEIQLYITEFDMFLKMGFVQFIFATVESSFRLIVRAIDPSACKGGTAEFKSVYDYLFKKLNLKNWAPLLDLWRNIRNTIHNNGVYFHRLGQDETVTYKGKNYPFVIGKPIDFVGWDLVLSLLEDIKHMCLDVINHPEVAVIPFINDPFAS